MIANGPPTKCRLYLYFVLALLHSMLAQGVTDSNGVAIYLCYCFVHHADCCAGCSQAQLLLSILAINKGVSAPNCRELVRSFLLLSVSHSSTVTSVMVSKSVVNGGPCTLICFVLLVHPDLAWRIELRQATCCLCNG